MTLGPGQSATIGGYQVRLDGLETTYPQGLRRVSATLGVTGRGGGATILEDVNAGLGDDFSIALSPVLFGS